MATAKVERKTSETRSFHNLQTAGALQSEHKVESNSAMSRSRSRSPYAQEIRQSSNSPLRLMQKQMNQSSLLLNANSFSNIKRQEASSAAAQTTKTMTLSQTQH